MQASTLLLICSSLLTITSASPSTSTSTTPKPITPGVKRSINEILDEIHSPHHQYASAFPTQVPKPAVFTGDPLKDIQSVLGGGGGTPTRGHQNQGNHDYFYDYDDARSVSHSGASGGSGGNANSIDMNTFPVLPYLPFPPRFDVFRGYNYEDINNEVQAHPVSHQNQRGSSLGNLYDDYQNQRGSPLSNYNFDDYGRNEYFGNRYSPLTSSKLPADVSSSTSTAPFYPSHGPMAVLVGGPGGVTTRIPIMYPRRKKKQRKDKLISFAEYILGGSGESTRARYVPKSKLQGSKGQLGVVGHGHPIQHSKGTQGQGPLSPYRTYGAVPSPYGGDLDGDFPIGDSPQSLKGQGDYGYGRYPEGSSKVQVQNYGYGRYLSEDDSIGYGGLAGRQALEGQESGGKKDLEYAPAYQQYGSQTTTTADSYKGYPAYQYGQYAASPATSAATTTADSYSKHLEQSAINAAAYQALQGGELPLPLSYQYNSNNNLNSIYQSLANYPGVFAS